METPNLCPKRLASLTAIMLLALSSPQTMRAQEVLYPHHFNLHEVTLLNGPLKTAQDLNFKTVCSTTMPTACSRPLCVRPDSLPALMPVGRRSIPTLRIGVATALTCPVMSVDIICQPWRWLMPPVTTLAPVNSSRRDSTR